MVLDHHSLLSLTKNLCLYQVGVTIGKTPEIIMAFKNNTPQRLDHFMDWALYDPCDGYYNQKIPIGRSGDYITAPEISQVFGEIVAAWMVNIFQTQAQTFEKIRIVEFGPGLGTWMADILTTLSKLLPSVKCEIYLMERCLFLKRAQQKKIASASYIESIDDLPPPQQKTLTFFLSNEFFDSLPIRQFIWEKSELLETYVQKHEQQYEFMKQKAMDHGSLHIPEPCHDHQTIYEMSPIALNILSSCISYISAYPTVFMAIDYGYFEPGCIPLGTLEAILEHKRCHPLLSPGQTDLSAHVNFNSFQKLFHQAGHQTYAASQGSFFKKLGFEERTEKLCQASPQAAQLAAAAHRLLSPSHMGNIFKVFASHSSSIHYLEGF